MVTIRIVEGTGSGPTDQAAFDAALAAAGAQRYNLVRLSSVIPAGAGLVEADDLSSLGATGDRLHVVQAVALTAPGEAGVAGLAWARTETGAGVFYEATAAGPDAGEAVESALEAGIEHGLSLRSWAAASRGQRLVGVDAQRSSPGCALVLAAYGRPDAPW